MTVLKQYVLCGIIFRLRYCSGHLRATSYGANIDKFDLVARGNQAPTQVCGRLGYHFSGPMQKIAYCVRRASALAVLISASSADL